MVVHLFALRNRKVDNEVDNKLKHMQLFNQNALLHRTLTHHQKSTPASQCHITCPPVSNRTVNQLAAVDSYVTDSINHLFAFHCVVLMLIKKCIPLVQQQTLLLQVN